MVAAQENQSACTECHGQYYDGGISGVSCTSCHLGGPSSKHPVDWFLPQLWKKHAGYATANGNTACANAVCHGSTLSGVANSGPSCTSCHLGGAISMHPTSWGTGTTGIDQNHSAYASSNGTNACANASCHGSTLTGVDGSGPSCSSCHLGGSTLVHPADWNVDIDIKHGGYVLTNGSRSCANSACHGTDLGGVVGSGPACVQAACHQNGSPLIYTGCTSCHGNPPTGTVSPNVKGAHTPHNALPNVTSVCNTCHSGAGTDTVNHFNGFVDVVILSTYNAKSGSAVYNTNGTCSKVSCHGGRQTPVWVTGAIDVNTQCTSCHVSGTALATPEYNSYYSGQHNVHVNLNGIACTECHDTTMLAVEHFTTLNTTTMEGSAAATIIKSFDYSGGSCTPSCHETRSW